TAHKRRAASERVSQRSRDGASGGSVIRAGDCMILESMLDGGAKDNQVAPDCARRALPPYCIAGDQMRRQLGDRATGEGLGKRTGGIGDASRCPDLRSTLAHVVCRDIGYEDFSGIARTAALCPCADEVGERDFSLFAVCRAS